MKKWTSLLAAALLTLTLAAGCGKTPVTSTVVPDDTIVTTLRERMPRRLRSRQM